MITLTNDGSDKSEPAERCCFCRGRTRQWFAPKDVAVCFECAERMDPCDVPSKAEWCAKEHALMMKIAFHA